MGQKYICFILDTPILQSYQSYYMLDVFTDHGYRLELLDISPFANPQAYRITVTGKMDYGAGNIHLCREYGDIYRVLDMAPEGAFAVTSFGWGLPFYPIFKYLSKRKIRYGHMILNSCYETAAPFTLFQRAAKFLRMLSVRHAMDVVFRRLDRKWFHVDACSFIINNSPSEIGHYKKRFYCGADTRFLVIHSNSYEEALACKDKKPLVDGRYCLWLDSYIPYHPDLAGMDIQIDAGQYYSSLRKFFHWVEDTFGVRVVVSAHPRSDYLSHPEAYEGFEVIKYHTCMLARDAEFIITSSSTSFLYAVAYLKPMVFIYNNEMEKKIPFHIAFIQNVCSQFHKTPICIDAPGSFSKELVDRQLEVDKACYMRSAREYIKQDFDGSIGGESYENTVVRFFGSL